MTRQDVGPESPGLDISPAASQHLSASISTDHKAGSRIWKWAISYKTFIQVMNTWDMSHRRHFSLTDFIAERGKKIISSTIELTWVEFQEMFTMV
jgi:hypothetical protein